MVSYDMKCAEGHEFEISFCRMSDAVAYLDSKPVCTSCDLVTERVFKPEHARPVIYNTHGFYGNVPTVEAHNSGLI